MGDGTAALAVGVDVVDEVVGAQVVVGRLPVEDVPDRDEQRVGGCGGGALAAAACGDAAELGVEVCVLAANRRQGRDTERSPIATTSTGPAEVKEQAQCLFLNLAHDRRVGRVGGEEAIDG